MYSSTLPSTSTLDGVGGQHHAPAALPQGYRYPFYRRLGGPQGRSGRVRKNSLPPRFDPQTAQHVASRCTDWAIPVPALMTRHFANTRRLLGLVGSTKTVMRRREHAHTMGTTRYTIFNVQLWGQSNLVPSTRQQLAHPKRRPHRQI